MQSTINISNYEEFFLLYVDNELSALDKKAVEEFVRSNPDLAVELEMLQQVQLVKDDLIFDEKETLYRKESAEINLTNCEEQFLLLVDDELTPDAKQKVETFVLQHPAVQEGFTLLKQTKLEAETIVFPHKKSLYRKEEKERPVFYMRWQRIAVAAALIGLAVAVWNVLPRSKEDQPQQAVAQVKDKNGSLVLPGNAAIGPSKNNERNSVAEASNNGSSTPAQTTPAINGTVQQNNAAIVSSNTNNNTVVTGEQPVSANNNVLAATEVPSRTVETVRGETVSTDNHNSFQTAVTNTQKITADAETHVIAASSPEAVTGGPNNNDSQPAVYRELDTQDEKKSLLLGSLEINKDKLRGFFRKAGSIFRSKAKTEDEKTESRPSSNTRAIR